MNKKNLKDNIKRIYNVILLLASVGILGAAVMIIHENEEKSIAEQKQYETISVQMIEKQLNISEDLIYNLVANNTDYPVITSESDNQRTLALVKISEYMTRETVLNNSVYYFFLYDTQRNSWVSRVGVNGNNNEIVYLKDYIKTTINGEKAAGYNWKLCNIHGNDYLIYIYRAGDVYVGAVADVNYLLNDIESITDNSIFLYDAGDSRTRVRSGGRLASVSGKALLRVLRPTGKNFCLYDYILRCKKYHDRLRMDIIYNHCGVYRSTDSGDVVQVSYLSYGDGSY